MRKEERKQLHLSREHVLSDFEQNENNLLSTSCVRKLENNKECIPSTSSSRMRINLPATALMNDIFGVSDRATAAIKDRAMESC